MTLKTIHTIYMNAIHDIDILLESEPNIIEEITNIIANQILVASGTPKLELVHFKLLENIAAYVIYYSFLLQSTLHSRANLINLQNNILNILSTDIHKFTKKLKPQNLEIYQLLRNKCTKLNKSDLLAYAGIISNIVQTSPKNQDNCISGIIKATDLVRSTIIPKLSTQYCFLYI